MNGLTDTLTIGLVLALVFGALFFYLYSRIGQVEKRISLTENILLDLKMATENTMMAMSSGPSMFNSNEHSHSFEEQVEHIEPVGKPEPVEKDEVEQIPDEDFYKQVLDQVPVPVHVHANTQSASSSHVDANYEAMTLKELKAEAKRKGVSVSASAHKKDVIDALKRQGNTVSVLEPVPGDGALEEGFPVDAEN